MQAMQRLKRQLPVLTGIFLLSTVASGIVYFVHQVVSGVPTQPKRVVQQITLLAPPPPPVEQPPPEIPKVQEMQEVEPPPQAANDEPPPGADLGVDADGSAGGDSFGLVGKKGGRDLMAGGPFAWYAGVLKQDITGLLAENKRVRKGHYTLVLNLWIDANGRVQRFELVNSTGSADLDHSLKVALSELDRVHEAPPGDMPQPVKLRITSRL